MRKRFLCQRNMATILTLLGCGGVVLTTVNAISATPKALQLIKKSERQKGKKLTKAEIVKATAPVYIPTVVIGTATIACIFGSNVLNKRCQQSLASAYALLNESFNKYRNTLIDLYGEETDIAVREDIVRKRCDFHGWHVDTPDVKVTFYEPMSGRTIVAYEREIMDAEYHLNRNFVLRGWQSLNEFYHILGIEPTELGEEIGWSVECGYYWIDFEHVPMKGEDGTTWYSIEPIFGPDEDYNWELH